MRPLARNTVKMETALACGADFGPKQTASKEVVHFGGDVRGHYNRSGSGQNFLYSGKLGWALRVPSALAEGRPCRQ